MAGTSKANIRENIGVGAIVVEGKMWWQADLEEFT